MSELELLGEYLLRLRSERLQQAHAMALTDDPRMVHVKACAHEAELCTRIHTAVKVLANDPGKFIKDFLT